jgi:hypothetical protein
MPTGFRPPRGYRSQEISDFFFARHRADEDSHAPVHEHFGTVAFQTTPRSFVRGSRAVVMEIR